MLTSLHHNLKIMELSFLIKLATDKILNNILGWVFLDFIHAACQDLDTRDRYSDVSINLGDN